MTEKSAAPTPQNSALPGQNSITAEMIAEGLDGKPTGAGKWKACCPAHDDRTPSLSISEGRDGRPLVYCFAGCDQLDVIDALRSRGLWHKPTERTTSTRPSPTALARVVVREAFTLALCASDLLAGNAVDAQRAKLALMRVQCAVEGVWP